jgi:hypothetical protein
MKARTGTPWIDADRNWFRRHPNRTYRLRRPFRGEAETLPNPADIAPYGTPGWRIIVWQALPGVRLRTAVQLHHPLPNDEETAEWLFHQALPIANLTDEERDRFIAQAGPGDNCQGCSRAFTSGEPTLAGFSHPDFPLNVGLCCQGLLRSLAAITGYFAPEDLPAEILAAMPPKGSA